MPDGSDWPPERQPQWPGPSSVEVHVPLNWFEAATVLVLGGISLVAVAYFYLALVVEVGRFFASLLGN